MTGFLISGVQNLESASFELQSDVSPACRTLPLRCFGGMNSQYKLVLHIRYPVEFDQLSSTRGSREERKPEVIVFGTSSHWLRR